MIDLDRPVAEKLASRRKYQSVYNLVRFSRWTPAPEEGRLPYLPDSFIANGYESKEFVDLQTLKPGNEIIVSGFSPNAFYRIRIGESNQITAWRDLDGTTTGLKATRDDLITYDTKTLHHTDHTAYTYPGFLFTSGFLGMEPGFSMPYFTYDDKNNVRKPSDAWMDGIVKIYVKR